jgi:hypothetical protein
MSNIITHYQTEDMFGQNSDTLNLLYSLVKNYSDAIKHFENLKNSIEYFNNIQIKIDVSIRFKSETFNQI